MAEKMWGGRFEKKTDPLVEEYTASIAIDRELALYDLIGSGIHATVLKEAGLISAAEYAKIFRGLSDIIRDMEKGNLKIDENAEDIHTDIQNKLEKKIGPTAKKLHTARSRNEQIVFDVKMYCKRASREVADLLKALTKSIVQVAKKNRKIIVPGYTHLQHAQPISLEHYFLAYEQMFSRDIDRLVGFDQRIKICLGSGAVAGTTIDSQKYNKAIKEAHKRLSFLLREDVYVVDNSIDNVSDRDFVLEALSILAILGMHLSRLAEDFVIWSSSEFGFIELDDAFCTGSSHMPHKKNSDVLELIRGNTGKLYGNLTSVSVMMKGLPLSYNRDMQLDKEPLFGSFNLIKAELKILAKVLQTLTINKAKIEAQLQDELLYATDLAYFLVDNGVAFKEAHRIVGELVKFSLTKKIKIKELSNEQLKKFSPYFTNALMRKIMDPVSSVRSKKSIK